jgi:hypothetical protein
MATAAHAGVGAVAAEVGLGCAGAVVGGVGPALLLVTADEGSGETAAAIGALTGATGAAAGVYFAGEWWGGRSADPGKSFLGAAGGAAVAALGAMVCFGLALRGDDNTDANEGAWIPAGLMVLFAGTPALATGGYNLAKARGGSAATLSVTPKVAVLAPRAPGVKPAVALGIAVSF